MQKSAKKFSIRTSIVKLTIHYHPGPIKSFETLNYLNYSNEQTSSTRIQLLRGEYLK
jgi:hypothetical protein